MDTNLVSSWIPYYQMPTSTDYKLCTPITDYMVPHTGYAMQKKKKKWVLDEEHVAESGRYSFHVGESWVLKVCIYLLNVSLSWRSPSRTILVTRFMSWRRTQSEPTGIRHFYSYHLMPWFDGIQWYRRRHPWMYYRVSITPKGLVVRKITILLII